MVDATPTAVWIILLKYAASIKTLRTSREKSAYQLDVRAETETAYLLSHTATGVNIVNRYAPQNGNRRGM